MKYLSINLHSPVIPKHHLITTLRLGLYQNVTVPSYQRDSLLPSIIILIIPNLYQPIFSTLTFRVEQDLLHVLNRSIVYHDHVVRVLNLGQEFWDNLGPVVESDLRTVHEFFTFEGESAETRIVIEEMSFDVFEFPDFKKTAL